MAEPADSPGPSELRRFEERYRKAFLAYLESGEEMDLQPAYELGRQAFAARLGLLDLAAAHESALSGGVLAAEAAQERALLGERAADFFRESLSTYEIARRGYLDVQEQARLQLEHARQLQEIADVSVAVNASSASAEILDLVTEEVRRILSARGARAEVDLDGLEPAHLEASSGDGAGAVAPGLPRLSATLTGRGGAVVGRMEVFGPADVTGGDAILTQLAQIASVGIMNAEMLGREREIARTLQHGLLPPTLPEVPGLELAARFRAAEHGMVVGGDFYDVFPHDDGSWGLVIGDVCGKGPAAAALTALARHTVRAASRWESRPEQVLLVLNAAIREESRDLVFCTALHGNLARAGDRVRVELATGGHPLPLVLRAGGRVEVLGSPGTLLGVDPHPRISRSETVLEAGELILLYTDGVTEVRRAGREVFGGPELEALLAGCTGLAAAEVAERVEHAVLRASAGRLRDDMAVLVLRSAP